MATCEHQHSPHGEEDEANQGNDTPEEDFELLWVQLAPEVVHKGMDLAQAEDSKGSHVLRGEDGLGVGQSVVRYRETGAWLFPQIPAWHNLCQSQENNQMFPACDWHSWHESCSYIHFDSDKN